MSTRPEPSPEELKRLVAELRRHVHGIERARRIEREHYEQERFRAARLRQAMGDLAAVWHTKGEGRDSKRAAEVFAVLAATTYE